MEFRILGPLEVVGAGGPAAVGGQRERALLARLLLSAGQTVSSAALTDDLWSGAPTEGAAQALWVHVSRLRKALRDHGGDDVLVTRPPGYALQVEPEAIDSCRFEALVQEGRRLAASGDPAGAAAAFRRALALWRGPALADVADAPFARAEAARLDEARLGVTEARIEADLAAGMDADLIGELASLTREHPLRERLWALRMTALYRAGRQAEALRTYQELRRYLGEELGIEPSEDLRALEGAILRHDAHLARPSTVPTPAAVAAPSGVVTFMFTDLVGSTELLDRLGDDAADGIRRRHFAALRQALMAHGGSEVKSLGDGLMATFASPVAAVQCAVEIQRTAASDPDESVAVRVGIHAGEAIADEDDFFGAPVVVAQRLCGRARGGQILASALVQGLAGTRAGRPFTTLGGLALKGFAEPVTACEVHWADPAARDVVPLPVPLARQDSVFVRPEADMARLEAAWESARSGRRQLVLLAGEPGIGKTRRSAEIARTAHAAGATVLYGRCDDRMGVPYQPFVEALGTYLRQAPGPELGRLAGELVRLVPEVGERFPDLPAPLAADPETERYRLFDAVSAWLAAVAAHTPTTLVIEDLHWATAPTLAMLAHLVRSGEPGRLLVVANYRDTQLDVTPELADTVADLLRQPDVERLRLGGLDPDGVVAYMEARARHQLDDAGRQLAGVLHAETAGNPFFLNQVLRHLIEAGALIRHDGRWSPSGAPVGIDVPETVRDVISQRLARLPDETGEILALAAVQGDRFELRVLVEAADAPQVSVLRALDPAITARLVTPADGPDPAHRFVHALVRHTIYDGLSTARRMELHRTVGTALAAIAGAHWSDHAADLARHWLAATPQVGAPPDEVRRTLDYAEEAARRASASLAYEEAAAQLARALPLVDCSDDPARRAALLVALGEAQYNAADAAHGQTLVEGARLALRLGDGELAARAALANQRPAIIAWVVDPERVALLEDVLGGLEPDDSTARARVLVALAHALHFSADPRRHELAREAVAVARRVADPTCLAQVLGSACFALWQLGNLAERVEMAAEMGRLAEREADAVLKFHAGLALCLCATQQGDLDRARAVLGNVTALAEELGRPALRLQALRVAGAHAMLDGRFADLERLATEALRIAEALGTQEGRRNYHAQMGGRCLVQGDLSDVVEHVNGAAVPVAGMQAALAWALAEAGQVDEARAIVAAEGSSFGDIPANYLQETTLVGLAAAAVALGDVDLARWLYPELLPYRAQIHTGFSASFGPIAHHLGRLAALLGFLDEADDHFAFAAALQERTGARGWLPQTRLEWARLLLRRARPGDGEMAHTQAGAAVELADDLGAPALAARGRQLLDTASTAIPRR